jgi:hypothetical protein
MSQDSFTFAEATAQESGLGFEEAAGEESYSFDEATAPGEVLGTINEFKRGLLAGQQQIIAGQLATAPDPKALSMRVLRRAFVQGMADPRYQEALTAAGSDPIQLQKVERALGPAAQVDRAVTSFKANRQFLSEDIAGLETEQRAIPQSEAMSEWGKADNSNWWKVLAKNPVEITAGIMAQSLPAMAPGMALNIIVPGGPISKAIGTGTGSGIVEAANTYLESARETGYDFSDPAKVLEFFENPEAQAKAKAFAVRRGVPIAALDALFAGLAGKFVGPALRKGTAQVVKASAKEVMSQAVGGAGGEALAQVAAGQPISLKDIVAEALGEIASGPQEVISNLRERSAAKAQAERLQTPRQSRPPNDELPPTPIVQTPPPPNVAEAEVVPALEEVQSPESRVQSRPGTFIETPNQQFAREQREASAALRALRAAEAVPTTEAIAPRPAEITPETTPTPEPRAVTQAAEVTERHLAEARDALAAERPPDVLDDVENVTSSPVRFPQADFADTFNNALQGTLSEAGRPTARTKRLQGRVSLTEGEAADRVLKALAEENPKYADWTADDLADAMIRATAAREFVIGEDTPAVRQLAQEIAQAEAESQFSLQERPKSLEGRDEELDQIALDLYGREYESLTEYEQGQVEVTLQHEDARREVSASTAAATVGRQPTVSARPPVAATTGPIQQAATAPPTRPQRLTRAERTRQQQALAQEVFQKDYSQLSTESRLYIREELGRGRTAGQVVSDPIEQRLRTLWDRRAKLMGLIRSGFWKRGRPVGFTADKLNQVRYIDGQLDLLREIANAPTDVKQQWFRAFTAADSPQAVAQLQQEFRFALGQRGIPTRTHSSTSNLQRLAQEEGLKNFQIVDQPLWTHNTRSVQAMTDRAGRVTVNAGGVGMDNDATVRRVLREERAHQLLTTAEGRTAVRRFASEHLTAAEQKRLLDMGYTGDLETLADEFIAKQARDQTSVWRQIVDKVRAWLAEHGLANLSNEEVARAILRSLAAARLNPEASTQAKYSIAPGTVPLPPLASSNQQSSYFVSAKRNLRARGYPEPETTQTVANAYHARDYAGALTGKNNFYILTPSTLNAPNPIPGHFARLLQRDFGGEIATAGTPLATREAKFKGDFLSKIADPSRFEIAPDISRLAQGRNVVLVDDILTSGETTTALLANLADAGVTVNQLVTLRAKSGGAPATAAGIRNLATKLSLATQQPVSKIIAEIQLALPHVYADYIQKASWAAAKSPRLVYDAIRRQAEAVRASSPETGAGAEAQGVAGSGLTEGISPVAGEEGRGGIEPTLPGFYSLAADPAGAPVWMTKAALNGALRVIRAVYRSTKSLAQAIQAGLEWLRAQNIPNYSETEAKAYLERSLSARPEDDDLNFREFIDQMDQADAPMPDLARQVGNLLYTRRTNESDAAFAARIITAAGGPQAAVDIFTDATNGLPGSVRMLLGQLIIRQLGAAGQHEAAARFYDESFAAHVTDVAQGLQSLNAWLSLTPEGKVIWSQRKIERAARDLIAPVQPQLDAAKTELDAANKEGIEATTTTPEVQTAARAAVDAALEAQAGKPGTELQQAIRQQVLDELVKAGLLTAREAEIYQLFLDGAWQRATLQQLLESAGIPHHEQRATAINQLYKARTKAEREKIRSRAQKARKQHTARQQQRRNNVTDWIRKARSIPSREIEVAAQRLVRALEPTKTTVPPALQEFYQRLTAQLKALLPEQPKATRQPLTDLQRIREVFTNPEKYAEVWQQLGTEIQAKYGIEGMTELNRVLGPLAPASLVQQTMESNLDRVIREQMAALRMQFSQIIRQHYTTQAAQTVELQQAIRAAVDLPEAAANQLALIIQRRFAQLVTARKQAALGKLLKPVRSIAKPTLIQKLVGLSNLGALSTEQFWNVVRQNLNLPEWSPELAARVRAQVDVIERIPNDQLERKQKAQIELLNIIERAKGIDGLDLGIAFYMTNILTGITTHLKNVGSTFLNATATLGTEIAQSVARGQLSDIPIMLEALGKGFRHAVQSAGDVLQTGIVTGSRLEKVAPGRALELTRFGYAGAVPVRNRIARALLESPLARILNLWKYNFRLMAAEDMFFFKPAEEAKAALLAKRMARSEGLRGTDAQDRARQILGYGVEATRRARVQAESEGFTGSAAKRRTAEIMNANRPEGLREEARQFALRTTFNNQPYGAMGAIAHVLNSAKQSSNRKVSVGANLVAPFLNIIANVVNESLNYTPIGAARALWPGDNLVGRPRAKLSLQEQADLKAELYSKAFVGTAMLAGLALAAARDLDDPDPEFAIYGQGPANDADRRGWLAKKALPHSIKFGNRYISYSNTPLAIPMAWLGNLFDRIRDARIYGKRGAQRLSENLPTMAATAAVGMAKVITEQSFLVGLMDVAETLSEPQPEASGRGLLKYTARTASSFVVPNALRQIDKAFDPTIYEQRTAEGILVNAIPFVRGKFGRPTLNALGLPATNPVSSQFTSTQASVPPLVKMLAETGNWPSLPDRNHIYPNKGRTMTEDEFYEYVRGSGQTAFNWLEKQRTNGNLAKYDNATRAKVISGYFEAARKQWRGQHGW